MCDLVGFEWNVVLTWFDWLGCLGGSFYVCFGFKCVVLWCMFVLLIMVVALVFMDVFIMGLIVLC